VPQVLEAVLRADKKFREVQSRVYYPVALAALLAALPSEALHWALAMAALLNGFMSDEMLTDRTP
jgi:hypothetical protein